MVGEVGVRLPVYGGGHRGPRTRDGRGRSQGSVVVVITPVPVLVATRDVNGSESQTSPFFPTFRVIPPHKHDGGGSRGTARSRVPPANTWESTSATTRKRLSSNRLPPPLVDVLFSFLSRPCFRVHNFF